MTGYQEIVTDPSYAEQLVCFTAPMVGNYGVAPARSESARPHARAVLMREARGPAWTDWLHEHGVVALSGIDTRSLVLHLRERGAMRAIAVAGDSTVEEALETVRAQPVDDRPRARRGRLDPRAVRSPRTATSASRSSTTAASARSSRAWPRPAPSSPSTRTTSTRTSWPATTACCSRTAPATPSRCATRSTTVRELLGRVPVLGICLGHQLLALATGLRDVQAPVRPPRREPSRARARDRAACS